MAVVVSRTYLGFASYTSACPVHEVRAREASQCGAGPAPAVVVHASTAPGGRADAGRLLLRKEVQASSDPVRPVLRQGPASAVKAEAALKLSASAEREAAEPEARGRPGQKSPRGTPGDRHPTSVSWRPGVPLPSPQGEALFETTKACTTCNAGDDACTLPMPER